MNELTGARWTPTAADGFRVTTRIITKSHGQALLVPFGALFPQDGGFAVLRIEGSGARLQAVTVEGRNGVSALVTKGPCAGQGVSMHPPAAVSGGRRVKARTP